MITVTGLNIYPIKSCQGIPQNSLLLRERGVAVFLSDDLSVYDRQWMLVSSKGQFLTQRELPEMARTSLQIEDQHLLLKHPSVQHTFALPLSNTIDTEAMVINSLVWGNQCQGYDEGDEVAKWFTAVLGEWQNMPIRLIKFNPAWQRKVMLDKFSNSDDFHSTNFADTSAYLIANEQSLNALNQDLESISMRVPMNRFRANIVTDGMPAWFEHTGIKLQEKEGRYCFSMPAPCPRCKIVTIEQQSANIENRNEPLQTIRRSNPHYLKHKKAYFGQHGVLLDGANQVISIDDQLVSL